MDTWSFINQSLSDIKEGQDSIINTLVGVDNRLRDLENRMARHETEKDFYTKEIDGIKETQKEIKTKMELESKINQKFRNYASVAWIFGSMILSAAVAYLSKFIFHK